MTGLAKALLGGVALGALAVAPAAAQHKHPAFNFTALHAGKAVNKTRMPNHGATHITYTFGVYGTIPAELDKKVPVGGFYKWNSYSTICSSPKSKIRFDSKKTEYGKLSAITETYSLGCPSGPTLFYGVAYKLTDAAGEGNTDHFASSLIGTFKNSHGKYKGTLNLDYSLFIQ